MRLIDADALLPMMKYATTDSEIGVFPIKIGFNTIVKVINDAPTINAEFVVRCKDCKWYEFDRKMYCGLPHGVRSKDDYCSDAERKEEY